MNITFKIPNKRANIYWIISSLIYLTLIYSTCLHYIGPEKTFRTDYLCNRKSNVYFTKYFGNDKGVLEEGKWKNKIKISAFNLWKYFGWGDAGHYILQSYNLDLSIRPFRYRILPTSVVGLIAKIFRKPIRLRVIPLIFLLLNSLLTFSTAILFTIYLNKDLNFSKLLSLVGGMLFITMVTNTRTVAVPLLEPASLFFIMIIFLALIRRNAWLFVFGSILGVATKEILIISSFLWFTNNISLKNNSLRDVIKTILLCSLPIIAFGLIRISLGGSIAEVHSGYDILKGEFPTIYGRRLLSFGGLKGLSTGIFLSFSFIWFGILNIKKNRFLLNCSIAIPLVILAATLLSSATARVLGILFPIIIPSFLLFFAELEEKSEVMISKEKVIC